MIRGTGISGLTAVVKQILIERKTLRINGKNGSLNGEEEVGRKDSKKLNLRFRSWGYNFLHVPDCYHSDSDSFLNQTGMQGDEGLREETCRRQAYGKEVFPSSSSCHWSDPPY